MRYFTWKLELVSNILLLKLKNLIFFCFGTSTFDHVTVLLLKFLKNFYHFKNWDIIKKVWKFFFIRVFFHRHRRFTGQQGKGGNHILFHSTTSTRSQTLRHLFATLHVRWLSRIFNRNACVYQTATRWDLPPYRIAIWLIDWWCNVCFFTWWIDSRFLLQQFIMKTVLAFSSIEEWKFLVL